MVNPSANEGEQALAEPAAPPPASRSVAAGEHQPRVVEHTRRRRGRRKAPMYTPKEVALMNYKDVDKLRRLLSDRGRMEPQRKTGLLAKDQRKLAREIKRARQIALLPYTHEHMWVSAQFRQEARAAARAERPPDEPPTAEPAAETPVSDPPPGPEAAPEAAAVMGAGAAAADASSGPGGESSPAATPAPAPAEIPPAESAPAAASQETPAPDAETSNPAVDS